MSRQIAVSTIFAAMVISGAAAGFWSGRWGSTQALREAAERLETVPLSLGNTWDSYPEELSDREVRIAELEGYVRRRYVHRQTGNIISTALVCGRPGPISVHVPEVCFTGAGYAVVGAPKEYKGPAGSTWQFKVQDFQKVNVATPTRLRIFMTWGHKQEWSVPAKPRLAFAGKPYLYKLYVVREMNRTDEPLDGDPAAEFIKELMPQLKEVLYRGS